jgi:hypothetical protein
VCCSRRVSFKSGSRELLFVALAEAAFKSEISSAEGFNIGESFLRLLFLVRLRKDCLPRILSGAPYSLGSPLELGLLLELGPLYTRSYTDPRDYVYALLGVYLRLCRFAFKLHSSNNSSQPPTSNATEKCEFKLPPGRTYFLASEKHEKILPMASTLSNSLINSR